MLICIAALALPVFSQTKSLYDLKRCSGAVTIPFSQAEQRVVEKGYVDIPALARQLRLQGAVLVEVCVEGSGEVVLTKVVSGHAILVQAAINSAKKWRFKPDDSGPFKTILEIPFSMGSTPAQIADEQKINDEFFSADDKCRHSIRSRAFEEAVKRCTSSVKLVEKLPKERTNERRTAYSLLGQAYFGQRKYDEALSRYKKELETALSSLESDQAELAYAYHHVALASHALGRASDAADNYAKAERTLSLAREHISLQELKAQYAATLKQIRENYLILLRQTGQTAAATELERRLQSAR